MKGLARPSTQAISNMHEAKPGAQNARPALACDFTEPDTWATV